MTMKALLLATASWVLNAQAAAPNPIGAQNAALASKPPSINHVLDLDGKGSYVELPPNIFTNLTEGTVELWGKWRSSVSNQRFFSFGNFLNDMGLGQRYMSSDLHFFVSSHDVAHLALANFGKTLDQWFHFAAISGKSGMKLYCNGVLIATNEFNGSFAAIAAGPNFLGRWVENQNLFGEVTLDAWLRKVVVCL